MEQTGQFERVAAAEEVAVALDSAGGSPCTEASAEEGTAAVVAEQGTQSFAVA